MNFTFFTDRDLGKRFPDILRAAGFKVERHADHFAPEASDEIWLEAEGRRHWIAVTHDQRIRYRPNERDAVMRHRVGLLVVVGKAPFPELAEAFVASRLRIERFLDHNAPPFIAKVYRPSPGAAASGATTGRVERWYPPFAPNGNRTAP